MEIVQQLHQDAKLLQSRGLLVKFRKESVDDPILSKEYGYKVKKTVDYINIKWDNDQSEVDRPVKTEMPDLALEPGDPIPAHLMPDHILYPTQWALFQAGKTNEVIGIPIGLLFPNDPGKADTYKHSNILTVEQLESTPDSTLQRFPGGLADKQFATKFLAKARDNFAIEQMQAETNNVKEENDFLKAQMRELQLQMSKMVEEKLKAAKAEPEMESEVNKNKNKNKNKTE